MSLCGPCCAKSHGRTVARTPYQQIQKIGAKTDGLLIAEGILAADQLARLAERIPIVLVAGSAAGGNDLVTAENVSSSAAVTRHMIE